MRTTIFFFVLKPKLHWNNQLNARSNLCSMFIPLNILKIIATNVYWKPFDFNKQNEILFVLNITLLVRCVCVCVYSWNRFNSDSLWIHETGIIFDKIVVYILYTVRLLVSVCNSNSLVHTLLAYATTYSAGRVCVRTYDCLYTHMDVTYTSKWNSFTRELGFVNASVYEFLKRLPVCPFNNHILRSCVYEQTHTYTQYIFVYMFVHSIVLI